MVRLPRARRDPNRATMERASTTVGAQQRSAPGGGLEMNRTASADDAAPRRRCRTRAGPISLAPRAPPRGRRHRRPHKPAANGRSYRLPAAWAKAFLCTLRIHTREHRGCGPRTWPAGEGLFGQAPALQPGNAGNGPRRDSRGADSQARQRSITDPLAWSAHRWMQSEHRRSRRSTPGQPRGPVQSPRAPAAAATREIAAEPVRRGRVRRTA